MPALEQMESYEEHAKDVPEALKKTHNTRTESHTNTRRNGIDTSKTTKKQVRRSKSVGQRIGHGVGKVCKRQIKTAHTLTVLTASTITILLMWTHKFQSITRRESKYYGSSGYWCWISSPSLTQRIQHFFAFEQYAWLYIALVVSLSMWAARRLWLDYVWGVSDTISKEDWEATEEGEEMVVPVPRAVSHSDHEWGTGYEA